MSGPSTSSNNLIGRGKAGDPRYDKPRFRLAGNKTNFTREGIRRLARRGGVKYVRNCAYDRVRDESMTVAKKVLKRAAMLTDACGKKTIKARAVLEAAVALGYKPAAYGLGIGYYADAPLSEDTAAPAGSADTAASAEE